jgi:NADH:ubiquinone oxidoreductase subunit F (NADH-binding)
MPILVSHPDEAIVLKRRWGQGATNIDKYLELDGYKAVQNAIAQGDEMSNWIINTMKASGLRGRLRPSRNTFWSMATSRSPVPAKITSSSAKTRTPLLKAR